jgi:uncharacterized protein (DUF2267 family)
MKENEFLARIQAGGALATRKEAKRWCVVVLGALTQLLPEAEARRHFISQLPGTLKATLLEEEPHALLMDRDAFLQHVASGLGTHVTEAERALHVVYGVLGKAVSAAQIAEMEAAVPRPIGAYLKRRKSA